MDINKSLRLAIGSGEVHVGSKQACKSVESGKAKLVIIASNCPEDAAEAARSGKSAVHSFKGNNSVLGAACGKPFPISMVAILKEGKSDVLSLKAD